MKIQSIALLLTLVVSTSLPCYAASKADSMDIEIVVPMHPNAMNPDNWIISIKDGDSDENGVDISSLDTSSITMSAMGSRNIVLGKVFLQIIPWDLYEVVVYTNSMDIDGDGMPDIPYDWEYKNSSQKQDFIDKHAGLQLQNSDYLDPDGFNSILYGAPLKIRSEGIHGNSIKDTGPIGYGNYSGWDFENHTSLDDNDSIPEDLWNGGMYPEAVQFSYIGELAAEFYSTQLPDHPSLTKVAGSRYYSPLTNMDGSSNWLEIIYGTSEKKLGSGLYKAKVYFELRWN